MVAPGVSQEPPLVIPPGRPQGPPLQGLVRRASIFSSALVLSWVFYNTTLLLLLMIFPALPLPTSPIVWLEPFRISNQYGLFAVMTSARYEIEFQGSRDEQAWVAYPFRYKPQNPREAPRIYVPYQPRFDWNLWFASLGGWRENPFVVRTEVASPTQALMSFPFLPGDRAGVVRASRYRVGSMVSADEVAEQLGEVLKRDVKSLCRPACGVGRSVRTVRRPEGPHWAC